MDEKPFFASIIHEPNDRLFRQGICFLKELLLREVVSAYYDVRNQGNLASGVFKVRSGGLGIPTPPEQRQASLAPGASREGCLYYSVTPQTGRYTVVAKADADETVVESRENNNERQITYDVR